MIFCSFKSTSYPLEWRQDKICVDDDDSHHFADCFIFQKWLSVTFWSESLVEAQDLECGAARAVANVCGKLSRVAHGIWSLLVLSALADSLDGFDGTHRKGLDCSSSLAFYCCLDMTNSCVICWPLASIVCTVSSFYRSGSKSLNLHFLLTNITTSQSRKWV